MDTEKHKEITITWSTLDVEERLVEHYGRCRVEVDTMYQILERAYKKYDATLGFSYTDIDNAIEAFIEEGRIS